MISKIALVAAVCLGGCHIAEAACTDSSTYRDVVGYGCASYEGYNCDHYFNRAALTQQCAKSCGKCPVTSTTCEDSSTWTDPSGYACGDYHGYACEGYAFSPTLVQQCPEACGDCAEKAPVTDASADQAESTAEAAGGADAAPAAGEEGAYQTIVSAVGNYAVSKADAQKLVDLTNKMRCAVGVPKVTWNAALAKQAQGEQDSIGGFSHSNCYSLPIPAGENLATGDSVDMANWMWFTEYTQLNNGGSTGHYTAMTWKGVEEMGCGMGNNVVRCQYKGSGSNGLPNMAGQEADNVMPFDVHTNAAAMTQCGLSATELKAQVDKFTGWGILNPQAGTYRLFQMFKIGQTQTLAPLLMMAGGVMAAVACVGITVKRALRMRSADEDLEIAMYDEGEE